MEGWTKILTSPNAMLAHMIILDLKAAGFEAILLNKKDSSYVNFGFCEIFVPTSIGLEAKVWLIDNHPDAQHE
jgi:hypothetical protein